MSAEGPPPTVQQSVAGSSAPTDVVPQAAPLVWQEGWSPDTARLAYEHAGEVARLVHDSADVLDRKVVAVFTVASAIATLGPVLGKFPLWSDGWWLSAGAAATWVLTAFECWRAFDPRKFRIDPHPATLATTDWLALSPAAFYVERLKSLTESVRVNLSTVAARASALRGALKCALVEVGFLLAALLWR